MQVDPERRGKGGHMCRARRALVADDHLRQDRVCLLLTIVLPDELDFKR